MSTAQVEQEIRAIVIARLESLPDNLKLSLGSEGEFSKQQLIAHVHEGDAIGKKIVEVQMHFLRSLKQGSLYEQVSTSHET